MKLNHRKLAYPSYKDRGWASRVLNVLNKLIK